MRYVYVVVDLRGRHLLAFSSEAEAHVYADAQWWAAAVRSMPVFDRAEAARESVAAMRAPRG